ncbi:MAG TPA: hypothetical protein DCE61_07660 [Cellvibrionales bacterium]|jgi:hypothetical protein|nr:hypothetical protein [Cellvibrionales bacterium]HCX27335.1 hypothetical protein [Cellvibrionales bacterium]
MITTAIDQQNTQSSYPNPYTNTANVYLLKHPSIEEPLKPYADFQQLKTAKVKAAKIKPRKSTAAQKTKPFIQLQGEWLAKAGFSTGKHCLIEVYKGMLVITLDEPINSEETIT